MNQNLTKRSSLWIIILIVFFFGIMIFLPVGLVAPRVFPIVFTVFFPLIVFACIFIYYISRKSQMKTDFKRILGTFTVPESNIPPKTFINPKPKINTDQELEPKICSYCGVELSSSKEKYCPSCGAEIK
ncbi:MAG: zinc-ribbon domain-containing protein [archaeon]|nr:zinc-ribbon domain-containing protein [archaeon]